jgi:uncharacterized repeat protein (TIGR01451 family)
MAIVAAAAPLTFPSPALASRPGPDLAVVAMRASSHQAAQGERITFTIVAVNHGPGPADQAVNVPDVAGLTVVSTTCAFGVSPDGPGTCEYGQRPVEKRFATKVVARAGTPGPHHSTATLTACTQNLSGEDDPVPDNNCRSVTIKLLARR